MVVTQLHGGKIGTLRRREKLFDLKPRLKKVVVLVGTCPLLLGGWQFLVILHRRDTFDQLIGHTYMITDTRIVVCRGSSINCGLAGSYHS